MNKDSAKLRLIAISFALCTLWSNGFGQDATKVEEEKTELTNVRGWILTSDPAVRLQLKASDSLQESNLASGGEGGVAVNSSYLELAPGNYIVELRSGDKVLESARGALRPGRHYTAVAWRNDSTWQLKVFADDISESNVADRPLRVLNFAGQRETLISLNGGAEMEVPQQTVQESKAPAVISMVKVKVLALDGGAPALSSVEVDFKAAQSTYVVIGPDYRGRMRPRVVLGGRIPDLSETATDGEQAAAGQL